jgi:protein-S-isoprenylcysteine O-methyltransferase Ste14
VRLPFRRKYLRARLAPLYLLALAIFALADPGPVGLVLGAALVSGGLALRAWGAGHLVKTDRLVTTGPYAHLRHPLYAGTLLVTSGLAAAAGPVGVVLLFGALLPFFFLYYFPYKERIESARLEGRYGAAYTAYRRGVPALWPARSVWRSGPPPSAGGATAGVGVEMVKGEGGWSAARYLANDEQGAGVASLLALVFIALRPALPF